MSNVPFSEIECMRRNFLEKMLAPRSNQFRTLYHNWLEQEHGELYADVIESLNIVDENYVRDRDELPWNFELT